MRWFVPIVVLLILAPGAWAGDAEVLAKGRVLFQQTLAKEKSAEASVGYFQQALKRDPKSPVLKAYLGASHTLEGRDAWMPWNKIDLTEKGLVIIDQALKSVSSLPGQKKAGGTLINLETYLVAANTFLGIPDDVFHRSKKGKRLLNKIIKHKNYSAMPKWFKGEVQKALGSLKTEKAKS